MVGYRKTSWDPALLQYFPALLPASYFLLPASWPLSSTQIMIILTYARWSLHERDLVLKEELDSERDGDEQRFRTVYQPRGLENPSR